MYLLMVSQQFISKFFIVQQELFDCDYDWNACCPWFVIFPHYLVISLFIVLHFSLRSIIVIKSPSIIDSPWSSIIID